MGIKYVLHLKRCNVGANKVLCRYLHLLLVESDKKDRQQDRLQAVPVGPQDVNRAGADVHHRHVDTCLSPASSH